MCIAFFVFVRVVLTHTRKYKCQNLLLINHSKSVHTLEYSRKRCILSSCESCESDRFPLGSFVRIKQLTFSALYGVAVFDTSEKTEFKLDAH
jgi:hypothetical protein